MNSPASPRPADGPAGAQTYGARDVANAPDIKAAIVRRSAARGDSADVAAWLRSHFYRFVVGNLQAEAPAMQRLDSLDTAQRLLGINIPVWIKSRLQDNGNSPIPQSNIHWIDPESAPVREAELRLVEFLSTRAGTPLAGKLMRVNALQALAQWEAEHQAFEARQLAGWRNHQPQAIRLLWQAPEGGGAFVELRPDSPQLREELAYESQCMRHCVGQFGNRRKLTGGYGEHYAAACEQGRMRLFSYRAGPDHSQPRITLSALVKPDGRLEVEQIKGKQNRPPVAKYHADVLAFLQSLNTCEATPHDALAIDLVRLPSGWTRVADVTGEADQLALFARHPDKLARVIAPSPLVQWLSAARTPDQVLAPADGALAQTLQLAGVVAARAGARP
ncbi:hypothetical protein CCO03_03155 [Comamonas serinivorans]|uniref:Collagen alpha-1(I) chain n=1 Tax=Comamonas serinivorans TaxID=1082851 RepID=A0A1Y0EJI9_9BURK|nr:hypothetical protein [Comamonas serinivorans]ARU03814.1 hypothetical protein CCO03_03155 [Comamonas serinivorans]